MVFITIALESKCSTLPCVFRFLFLCQAGRGRFEMRRYKIKSKIRCFEFPLLDHSLNTIFGRIPHCLYFLPSPSASKSVRVAITKYYTLSSFLKNRYFCSGGWKFEIWVPEWPGAHKSPLTACRLQYPHVVVRGWELSGTLYKVTNPLHEGSIRMT